MTDMRRFFQCVGRCILMSSALSHPIAKHLSHQHLKICSQSGPAAKACHPVPLLLQPLLFSCIHAEILKAAWSAASVNANIFRQCHCNKCTCVTLGMLNCSDTSGASWAYHSASFVVSQLDD